MTPRVAAIVAALLGALLLLAGLLLGYSTISRDGLACGSAFGGAAADTAGYPGCAAALSDREGTARALAWPGGILLALGVAGFAYVTVGGAVRDQRARQAGRGGT